MYFTVAGAEGATGMMVVVGMLLGGTVTHMDTFRVVRALRAYYKRADELVGGVAVGFTFL